MRVLAFLVLGACALLFVGGLALLLIASAAAAFVLGGIMVIARRLTLARVGVALLVVSAAAALVYAPLRSFVARVTAPSHG